ncbi:MAG: TonB-dependent receptor plug domain-containing protein [Lewinella sp.]
MRRTAFLLTLFALLMVSTLEGQRSSAKEKRYLLPRRQMPLEKALIKLTEGNAPLSYRPDQLPQIVVSVPGGRKTLVGWLSFLLKDTELAYRKGPAGYLIVPDLDLFNRDFTIHGLILDASSGERLIGSAIQDIDNLRGVLANEYGFYSLETKGGRKRFRVSYTGYASMELDFVLRRDTVLEVRLEPAGYLPQIEVRASADSSRALYLLESERSMSSTEVGLLNGPGGEASILSLARMLPGVTSGADGVGGLSIRGSNSGHNLVLFDGVPVYNLNHAAGLFSIFNTSAIRRADLYKDGIPARFGGRIGGVLDVHTRDGNLYHPEVSVGSSLLSSTVTAEGPLKSGKSSFLVSGRYFWGGDLLRTFSEQQKQSYGRDGAIDYAVYDLNLKLNQQVGKKGRVYLSLYRGLDDYGNDSQEQSDVTVLEPGGTVLFYEANQNREEQIRWGNTVGALRYNHLFNDRFFGNFRLSYSDLLVRASFERSDSLYEVSNESLTSDISSGRFGSAIRQFGAAFDGQYNLTRLSNLRFGAAIDAHRFLPQIRSGRVPLTRHPILQSLGEGDALRSVQVAAYGSFDGQWKGLHYRAGLRGQIWRNGVSYINLSPRLMLAAGLGKHGRWKVTYDQMVQPIHLVSSTVIGLPTDLWVPSTPEIAPSTVSQVGFSYNHDLTTKWQLEVELYHRDMRHLVDYTESGQNNGWVDNLSVGKGFANGAEFSLHYAGRRLRGWVSYTLAESRRQFDESINRGRPFPFQFDRRHGVKLLATYNISPTVNLTGTWRYGSGAFYSLSLENFLLADPSILESGEDAQVIPLVENKNGFNLPANHRLDVNAQFLFGKKTRSFQHMLNVGIYNLYGRHNPIFYDLRTSFRSRGSDLIKDQQFVQVYFGGIQPTLSYQLTFSGKR